MIIKRTVKGLEAKLTAVFTTPGNHSGCTCEIVNDQKSNTPSADSIVDQQLIQPLLANFFEKYIEKKGRGLLHGGQKQLHFKPGFANKPIHLNQFGETLYLRYGNQITVDMLLQGKLAFAKTETGDNTQQTEVPSYSQAQTEGEPQASPLEVPITNYEVSQNITISMDGGSWTRSNNRVALFLSVLAADINSSHHPLAKQHHTRQNQTHNALISAYISQHHLHFGLTAPPEGCAVEGAAEGKTPTDYKRYLDEVNKALPPLAQATEDKPDAQAIQACLNTLDTSRLLTTHSDLSTVQQKIDALADAATKISDTGARGHADSLVKKLKDIMREESAPAAKARAVHKAITTFSFIDTDATDGEENDHCWNFCQLLRQLLQWICCCWPSCLTPSCCSNHTVFDNTDAVGAAVATAHPLFGDKAFDDLVDEIVTLSADPG